MGSDRARRVIEDYRVADRISALRCVGERVDVRRYGGTITEVSHEGIHFRVEFEGDSPFDARWFYAHELVS